MEIRELLNTLKTYVLGWTQQYGIWTPYFAGFSIDPDGGIYRYVLNGKMCTVFVEMPAGTSNDTILTLSAPFTAATQSGMYWRGLAGVVMNNSAAATEHPGRVYIASATNTIICLRTIDGTGTWTNSGTKRICFSLTYEVE